MDSLEFYAVRSKDGKWFRSKGYGGGGDSWVDELKKAKIFTSLGGARSQVTFWTVNYPEYGVPDIVVLSLTETRVLDETARVAKAKENIRIKEERDALRRAKEKREYAEREYQRAKERLEAVKAAG